MLQKIDEERIVLCILTVSFSYALISNLITHCSPLPLYNILDIMASIDETLRNCCYGVIASIAFYLVNDFYKNSYKQVDLYSEMYPDLYDLWFKTYQLVLALNNYELCKEHNNDELRSSIVERLSNQNGLGTYSNIVLEVPSDEFHILYVLWNEELKDKDKFLEVYGHVINREEYSKLNDKELDFSIESLKEHKPDDEQIAKATMVSIRNYDLQCTINLILKYKTDLASMVNKYSIFYYGNQRGIQKNAF